tara:strand:- start:1 stop:2202 length:2202 start_codon:yes stop_codon:yes gene_type:complete
MNNKFLGFFLAFAFLSFSAISQDLVKADTTIEKLDTLVLQEVSKGLSNDDITIGKIDDLVYKAISQIESSQWKLAYSTLQESNDEFGNLEKSYLCDDSKINELLATVWENLPSEQKIIIKTTEAEEISKVIISLEKDISEVKNLAENDEQLNKFRNQLNLSDSAIVRDISDKLNDELSKNRISLNTAYEVVFSDEVALSQFYNESEIVELNSRREESWKNIPLDNKINAYTAPLTNGIVGLVFSSVTIRSCDPTPFSTIKKDLNGCSPIKVPFVLIWLLLGSVLFTIYFGFVNITGFKHALDVVRGKFDDPNKKEAGEVSHFQALTAALSGTVGVGNIAGVAIAVSIGGPGATFWMIVAGLLGMSAKFVECTLGTKYRKQNDDGSVSGGPMYYLSNGLAKKGASLSVIGKVLAVFFAIACVGGSFGGGCMVQINQATKQLITVTGGSDSFLYSQSWIFGAVMAVLVGLIIIGGIKSIARVTDKIVPFMVGIYLIGAIIVLGGNIGLIPNAFGQIFGGAFSSSAMYGGIIGVLIQGFRRAAFSNEAGIGSASIAHSAAKTDEPVSEGMVSLLEPFIDTVVICTMTALVIIISGYGSYSAEEAFGLANSGDLQAIELTSSAFSQTIPWFPIILSGAVILFALSTMISWSYYGLKAWTYLFGESKVSDVSYKTIFCVMVIIGSAISAQSVFDFGDAMIFAMCFPNVLGLYFLAPEVKQDLKDYLKRVKSGEIKRFD